MLRQCIAHTGVVTSVMGEKEEEEEEEEEEQQQQPPPRVEYCKISE